MKPTTALIVDDEALARKKLRLLLSGVPWIDCVGEVGDGKSAIAEIDRLRPDLVFLDIELPGASGLEVLGRIRHAPSVIFTTAYDRHAVTAFDLAALDYLVKPFGKARFLQALERARPSLTAPAERLFVRDGAEIVPLRTADIESLEAEEDGVRVRTQQREYTLPVPLHEVEKRLDRSRFVGVRRGHLVNLDHVVSLVRIEGSRFQVRLRGGSVVTASREGSRLLRDLGV